MEINFYGVLQEETHRIVAILLSKAYETQKHSCLLVDNKELADFYNVKLWSFASWLPHCLHKEPKESEHPVVIYNNMEHESLDIKNAAEYLFIVGNAMYNNLEIFKKIYIIFNLKNPQELKSNRSRWKELQQDKYDLSFYKQDERGKFNKTIL